MEAIRRGDAAGIVACWTDDGVYVDASGKSVRVKDLPAEQLTANVPQEIDAPTTTPASALHFVTPTVAVEQSLANKAVGEGTLSGHAAQFVAAWVKQNGRWRLSFLREFSASATTAPAARPHDNPLDKLAWMEGQWTASNESAEMDLTAEWTPNKSFLIQRFSAQGGGRAQRSGEQRIARDAATGKLRSWTFNADGSYAEGHWIHEGDVWIVAVKGVLADGRPIRSTHFWLHEGDDVCWFKSLNGEVDGQPAADLVLKFSRQPQQTAK
jgi:hypothetical protein